MFLMTLYTHYYTTNENTLARCRWKKSFKSLNVMAFVIKCLQSVVKWKIWIQFRLTCCIIWGELNFMSISFDGVHTLKVFHSLFILILQPPHFPLKNVFMCIQKWFFYALDKRTKNSSVILCKKKYYYFDTRPT